MKTLGGRILHNSLVHPDGVFLTLLAPGKSPETVTYGRLMTDARAYTSALKDAGVGPNDIVLCISPTCVPLVVAFAAITLCGAVPAMLPFPTPKLDRGEYRRRLRDVIRYTKPAVVMTDPEGKEDIAPVVRDEAWPRAFMSWNDVSKDSVNTPIDPVALGDENGPALLQYSSGTTGLQKGVVLSHRALLKQIDTYAAAIRLTSDDVIVSWLPLYHDMGLIAGFVLPLVTGTPLVLMSPLDWVRDPALLLRAIDEHRGTLAWLPNFAYNFLAGKLRESDCAGLRLDSLRAVINCSEPMSARSHDLFARRFSSYGFRRGALATCYAMAENTFAVTQGGIDKPVTLDVIDDGVLARQHRAQPADANDRAPRTVVSAGAPIEGVRVRVLGESGADLDERQVGELVIKSDCMLSEYFGRPDLTAQAFADGWFLTGDYGYVAGGEIYVTGRKKDLIIVGGVNLYPHDIEAAVNDVPGVHPGRCVAFGLFDEEAGTESVVVVAEVETESRDERNAISGMIRDRIARNTDCVVRNIHLVGPMWLLKTSSGKVARHANKEKYCLEKDADRL
jgi:fatty-acyl-CoA synthase